MNPPHVECPASHGTMPPCAPLATPYVPFQQPDPDLYDAEDALREGTLYPALDLPFFLAVKGAPVEDTPQTRLQALCFVLQELALYLDTHPEDAEAFALFQKYTMLKEKAEELYHRENPPLTHAAAARENCWNWAKTPWPWDQKGGK